MQIRAPISVGELIDKITILQIKLKRLDGPGAANVAKELAVLNRAKSDAHLNELKIAALIIQLKAVNVALWDIEDQIRQLEACGDFGLRFIETARSIYKLNDRRAAIKRLINVPRNRTSSKKRVIELDDDLRKKMRLMKLIYFQRRARYKF